MAIVVHIYKSSLSEYERISLTQLHRVLATRPVYVVAPQGLDVNAYKKLFADQLAGIIFFSIKHFKNLHTYNRLLLSKAYYKPYLDYEYILLHHTDAFVFKDELDDWMNRDYDNLGAPIYGYDGTMNPKNLICCGNGGLCLRKVKTFYNLADSFPVIYKYEDIRKDFLLYNWKGRIYRSPYYFLLLITAGSRLHSKINRVRLNEDVIWSYCVARYCNGFESGSFEDGFKFSMEFNCDKLLALNQGRLPFGCHGWYKPMFIDFWRPYIEAQGYQLL